MYQCECFEDLRVISMTDDDVENMLDFNILDPYES